MIDLALLQQAIDERRLVSFDYVDKKGNATHRADNEAYEIKGGYLYAFCPVKQQIHSYLIGSMANLFVQEDTYTPRW